LVHRGLHREWALVEGGTTQAKQTRLTGLHFYDDKADLRLRCRQNGAHLRDFKRPETFSGLSGFLGPDLIRAAGQSEKCRRGTEACPFEHVASVHKIIAALWLRRLGSPTV